MKKLENLLREVCSIPTAPFAEGRVVSYITDFVKRRPRLRLSRDESGNLLITLPGRKRSAPRWLFAAHMDHPGFVARKMIDPRTLDADAHGWFGIEYVTGARLRFFDGEREIAGTVIEATRARHDLLTVPKRVTVGVAAPVSSGSPGMFDQGAGRFQGRRFLSRGIDDQGGLAAALAMIDALCAKRGAPPGDICLLLTRAEEEGFIGAVAAVLKPKLLRNTDRIIAIECSAVQPYAPQGNGVIIRVGDKTSVFNSALTYFMTQQAAALAAKDKSFQFQRALMPGGTCEATVYDAYGYTAAAVCIPLGNYHNMDRAKRKIAPEYIDVGDWKDMVKLFIHLANNADKFTGDNTPLKKRIEKRYNRMKKFLG